MLPHCAVHQTKILFFLSIDQQEKEIKLLGGHKRGIEDLEDKLKKAETAKEKLEKSKEEAIQALKDKVKTLQESHGEEIQNLKTDQAKYLSETEMLRGKLQSLEALTSSKENQSVQIIEEINASKAKAIEDLNLARVQLETMSKNMENVENELENLKPLVEQVKEMTKDKQSLEQKVSKLETIVNDKEALNEDLKNEKQSLEKVNFVQIL